MKHEENKKMGMRGRVKNVEMLTPSVKIHIWSLMNHSPYKKRQIDREIKRKIKIEMKNKR